MRNLIIGLSLALLLASQGCDDKDIHVYKAPKEVPDASTVKTTESASEAGNSGAGHVGPSWTLPAGWNVQPTAGGGGMRFATLVIDGGPPPLELTVIPLALAAGNVLDNVNRWRGQVGLELLSAEQLPANTQAIDAAGHSMTFVNLLSADKNQRLVAAMTEADGQVWFFKVIGPAQPVEKHIEEIRKFVASVRFGVEAEPAEGLVSPSSLLTTPAGEEAIRYDKPAGWEVDPNAGQMRVASFILGEKGDEGAVSVTRFPGDVGGTLANLNRWRSQVNLPSVTDLKDQPIFSVEVDGIKGMGFDLIEPKGDASEESDRKRMLVVQVPRAEMTWFFKMSGPTGLVQKNRDAFMAFVKTVKFQAEKP